MNFPSRFRSWALPLLAVTAFLSGCATTHRTALTPEARATLGSIETIGTLSQPEIGADINASNITAATGGGLLFALIDAGINTSRAKKAEGSITPLRDALLDYDVGAALAAALGAKLQPASAPATTLPVTSVVTRAGVDAKTRTTWVSQSPADGVLVVTVEHRLNPSFQHLQVHASAVLYPRTPDAAKLATGPQRARRIYRNAFFVERPLPEANATATESEQLVQSWAENQGARARQVIEACFGEIAAMLAYDLERDASVNMVPVKECDTLATMPRSELAGGGLLHRAKVEQQHGERKWVRFPTGELASL